MATVVSDRKIALVTGGGSGIGRTTAVKFSINGYNVIVADIDKKSADETVELLKIEGLAVEVDVTNESQVEAMVTAAVDKFGRIDVCFNNAGLDCGHADLSNVSYKEFSKVMDVNVIGTFLCMKHEVKQFMKQAPLNIEMDTTVIDPNVTPELLARSAPKPVRGYIVNMSSIAGVMGVRYISPYVASKWAVVGMTKAAGQEYAGHGILINCICPAFTASKMSERFSDDLKDRIISRMGVGRFCTAGELAEIVIWLSSGKCTFMAGEVVTISGSSV
eukprot:TRINITY_DN2472_c0_g1_i10.p2 TRINITY_DN2472_c0_g1~~TRINITY_DN2472_c0_g1_i10.p2  ORF type:complete len:275 (+),score=72.70 TRINITY_DN2472_c0_g1_i10:1207-2031(+)